MKTLKEKIKASTEAMLLRMLLSGNTCFDEKHLNRNAKTINCGLYGIRAHFATGIHAFALHWLTNNFGWKAECIKIEMDVNCSIDK